MDLFLPTLNMDFVVSGGWKDCQRALDALKQAGKLDTFEEREEVLDSNIHS